MSAGRYACITHETNKSSLSYGFPAVTDGHWLKRIYLDTIRLFVAGSITPRLFIYANHLYKHNICDMLPPLIESGGFSLKTRNRASINELSPFAPRFHE